MSTKKKKKKKKKIKILQNIQQITNQKRKTSSTFRENNTRSYQMQ